MKNPFLCRFDPISLSLCQNYFRLDRGKGIKTNLNKTLDFQFHDPFQGLLSALDPFSLPTWIYKSSSVEWHIIENLPGLILHINQLKGFSKN